MGSSGGDQAFAIRRVHAHDLRAILRIERQVFGTPWSATDFVFELAKPRGICLAAVDRVGLAGYIVCSPQDALWNLRNLAVHPERRRRGIASALVGAVLERRCLQGGSCFLEARPSDADAVALYERFGFWPAGRLPAFYRDDGEDAVIMWRDGPPPRADRAAPGPRGAPRPRWRSALVRRR